MIHLWQHLLRKHNTLLLYYMYYKLTKLHLPQNVTAVDNILIPAGWNENRNNSLHWRAEPQIRLFWKQEPRKLKNMQRKLLCIFLFHLLQKYYEIWNFLAIYFSVYSNTPLRSFFFKVHSKNIWLPSRQID